MKITRFLLGICCAGAALISCSKADSPKVEETHPMSFTISTDDVPTKTTITYDGSSYSHTWKSGDAFSVISIVSETESYMDKFVLTSGAGTKTGTFSCATSHIPTTGSKQPTLVYPYTSVKSSNGLWWVRSLANQGNGSLANLGDYAMIYAKPYFVDGEFSHWPSGGRPSLQVAFFKLPAGLQIVGNASGNHSVDIVLSGSGSTEIKNELLNNVTLNTATTNTGDINLTGVSITDGKLVQDTYIAFCCPFSALSSYDFVITVKEGTNSVSYSLNRTSHMSEGKVYNLKQSHFTPVQNF